MPTGKNTILQVRLGSPGCAQSPELPAAFDANDKPLYNTNWEKEVYKPAFSNSHHINLQGGNDKSLYSLSPDTRTSRDL